MARTAVEFLPLVMASGQADLLHIKQRCCYKCANKVFTSVSSLDGATFA